MLDRPPSIDAQEVTDKGSVNQKAVLAHRAALVELLYGRRAVGIVCDISEGGGTRGDSPFARRGPLAAIDVHVHLEVDSASAADTAARQYFGESGAPRDRQGFADYYRSRKMACVVFTVDEHLTGRQQPSNDEVVQFAADNADVAIAFASIDPDARTRGRPRGAAARGHRVTSAA